MALRVTVNADLPVVETELSVKEVRGQKIVEYRGNNAWAHLLSISYNLHRVPVIRPDDVYLLILASLSKHVNENTEHYRAHLADKADPNNKTLIEIVRDSGFNFADTDAVLDVFNEFAAKVDAKCATSGLLPALKADFSTTQPVHALVSQVALAEMVKDFFGMKMMLGCGWRYIDFEGTRDDWTSIIRKLARFGEIAHPSVTPFLARCTSATQHIVDAYDGKIDASVWERFFYDEYCGSGSQTEHRGWALDFFISDKEDGYKVYEESGTRIAYDFRLNDANVTLDAGPLGVTQGADGRLSIVYDYVLGPSKARGFTVNKEPVADIKDIDFKQPGIYATVAFEGQPLHFYMSDFDEYPPSYAVVCNVLVGPHQIWFVHGKPKGGAFKIFSRPVDEFYDGTAHMAMCWSSGPDIDRFIRAACGFKADTTCKPLPEGAENPFVLLYKHEE
jgi:hypothetical protein